MKEIKLTIDGKEVKLTDEQLMTLGIEVEKKRKNPFSRATPGNEYYYIIAENQIDTYIDVPDNVDDRLYTACNYFNDKSFANQVALHQLLYRKLLKFAYDNECEDTAKWDGMNCHWLIEYVCTTKDFIVHPHYDCKSQGVYFSSDECAKRAIKEVVEPFMEEHPEFVW